MTIAFPTMQTQDYCTNCKSKVDCLRCHFKIVHGCTHHTYAKTADQDVDCDGVYITLRYHCEFCKIQGTQHFDRYQLKSIEQAQDFGPDDVEDVPISWK